MMKRYTFFIFLILYLLQLKVYAQGCCTAGTASLGGAMSSIIPENYLSVMTKYESNFLGNSYTGRAKISDPLNRSATVTFVSLNFEYGLAKKISLLGIISYNYRERNITVTSASDRTKHEDVKFSANGLGDIVLLAKYELISPDFFSPFTLSLGGGAKLPVGDFRKEDNGTRLPVDLQPGSGAVDLMLWGYVSDKFRKFNLSLYSSILYTYKGTNLNGYKVGDELIATIGGDYNFTEYVSVSLRVRGRFANPDYADSRILSSTGNTSYDLLPYLNYYEGNFSISIYKMFPLYRNVRGIQLMVSDVFGLQFQYLLNFN